MPPVLGALAATTFVAPDKLILASPFLCSGGAGQLLLAVNRKKMRRPLRGTAGVGRRPLARPEGDATGQQFQLSP
jgi:hypothetical protein